MPKYTCVSFGSGRVKEVEAKSPGLADKQYCSVMMVVGGTLEDVEVRQVSRLSGVGLASLPRGSLKPGDICDMTFGDPRAVDQVGVLRKKRVGQCWWFQGQKNGKKILGHPMGTFIRSINGKRVRL